MNKGKLRSLMFHAGFCNEDGGWDNRPLFEQEHDNFQRFAELIVNECADIVAGSSLPDAYSEPVLEEIADEMREWFGVKND